MQRLLFIILITSNCFASPLYHSSPPFVPHYALHYKILKPPGPSDDTHKRARGLLAFLFVQLYLQNSSAFWLFLCLCQSVKAMFISKKWFSEQISHSNVLNYSIVAVYRSVKVLFSRAMWWSEMSEKKFTLSKYSKWILCLNIADSIYSSLDRADVSFQPI